MEQAINKWVNKVKAQAQIEFDDVQDPIHNPDLFKDPIIREMAKVLILKHGAEYIRAVFADAIDYRITVDGDVSWEDIEFLHDGMRKAFIALSAFRKNFE